MAKKGNRRRRLSVFDRVLLAVSIVLIGVSAGIIGYVSLMNWAPLPEVDESGNVASIDEEIQTAEENRGKVTNFLVTGIDYNTLDPSAGTARGKLTDVIMVVQLNLETNEVNILQIPRDTYVGTDVSSTGKINGVYSRSGLEGLAQVIYDRFKLPVDHYANVIMDGFIRIVDAVGGVEIDIQESFTLEGYTFYPGVQTLNGIQAEKFVRERYSRGSDIGRLDAQRQFLAAMFQKFKSLSLGELTNLVPTVMDEVTTDLNVRTVLSLIEVVMNIEVDDIHFYTVPGEGCTASNGQSVWSVHLEPLAELLNENFRPFDDPVPAAELNLVELQNTTDYYDDNKSTVGDILDGGE